MKQLWILILTALTLMFSSCNDATNTPECEFETLISAEEFVTAPSDPVSINTVEIEGNCLVITFSASGCSGDTWEVKLIDSESIMESLPPQRNLRLSLKNEELCEAYISKEMSFDISNLQVEGYSVQLNLLNSNESVLYSY